MLPPATFLPHAAAALLLLTGQGGPLSRDCADVPNTCASELVACLTVQTILNVF